MRQTLLRSMGFALAVALAGVLSAPAQAATLEHSGTFADFGGNPESAADQLSLSNSALSDADILTIVIDLTTATHTSTSWQPATFGFTPTGGTDVTTGYVSNTIVGDSLTITFNDFNAGETFTFTIDLDDNNNVVSGANIAGSTVTATFDIFGGADLVAVMANAGGDTANWTATVVPEPSTVGLLSLGLTGLAWGGRRR